MSTVVSVLRSSTIPTSMSEKDSPIQAYCTFVNRCTPTGDGGLYCDKCRTRITDLTDMSPKAVEELRASNPRACGFVRTVGISALASALALSPCQSNAGEEKPERAERVPNNVIRQAKKDAERTARQSSRGPAFPGSIGTPAKPAIEYPVAKAVEGEPNMVISPYTGKKVNVKGLKPGALVLDPKYLPEHKIFRLP